MILPLQYLVAQKKSIKALDVDGYYRFLGFHRNIHNLYTNSNIPSTFQANDDFNSPSVNLNLNLTTFKTSLYLLITWRKLCYQKTIKNTSK